MKRPSRTDTQGSKAETTDVPASFPLPPRYRLIETMEGSDGLSGLALDPQNRRVVLKPLPQDCLLGAALHPMIKDRLAHVRDLAHLGIAQLYAVEAVDGHALLVWEFVEGQTLESSLADPSPPNRALARDLILAVDALHALGIVHGALHERNIILTPDGGLRLTHISPLLYTDPDADVQSLRYLLERMNIQISDEPITSLRELANQVINPLRPSEGVEDASTLAAARRDRRRRRRMIGLALVVAAIGAASAWGLWRFAQLFSPPDFPAV